MDVEFDVTDKQWHFISINDRNVYEFPQLVNKTIMCTNMTVDINTAPRVSGEPSGNNLVLISKKR